MSITVFPGITEFSGTTGVRGLYHPTGIARTKISSAPLNPYFSDNAKTNQYFTDNAYSIPYDTTSSGTIKLPGDAVIALFGDSLEQHNGTGAINAGSEEYSQWSRGYYNWTRMLDPRGRWLNWYDASFASKFFQGQNQGQSGNQLSQMVSRITDVTNIPGLKLVICGGGTNDINADVANSVIISELQTCFNAIKAVGAKIIYVTPPTRDLASWGSGSAERTNWMSFCISMQAVADADPSNIKIVRRDRITSNDDADLTPITGYLQSDGIHLTPLGGYACAIGRTGWPGLIDVISPLVDSFTLFPAAVATGDIAPNPTCTGTSGTVGTGCTGTAPTGMRIQRASVTGNGAGVSCVGSQETISGISYQKMVFTRDGTGGTATFNIDKTGNILSSATPSLLSGTWWRAFMQFKANPSAAFQAISIRARGQPSTPAAMDAQSMKIDTGLPWPNISYQKADGSPLWTVSPPLKLREGTTSVIWASIFVLDNTTAGTDTIWVSRMQLIPAIEPTQQLGYE